MSIGLDFILRATTEGFTRGMAHVNNSIKDVKKSLSEFDVGNGLKQALGIGGIIAAFRGAINHAQDLRKEMEATGKKVDENVASVAAYGDAIDSLTTGTKNLAMNSLAFFTKAGEAWGKLINYARGYSFEQQQINEDTEKAAILQEKRLAAARAKEPARRTAAEKRLEAADAAGMTPEEKTAAMMKEAAEVQAQLKDVVKGSTKEVELKARAKELQNAFVAAENKDAADAQKELKEKNADAAKKEEEARKFAEKFAPSVEQLGQMETGGFTSGNDPRLEARRILEKERRATILGGRGDIEGAMKLGREAKEMRDALSGKTGTGTALTAETAETALRNALDETNKKLVAVEAAMKGIIKAQ